MKEADIVSKLQKWIRDHSGLVIKQHGSAFAVIGTPDLIGSIPVFCRARMAVYYVHFAVEVKMPGKFPTEIQKQRLSEWQNQYFLSGVVTSVADFQKLVESFVSTSPVLMGVSVTDTDKVKDMVVIYA